MSGKEEIGYDPSTGKTFRGVFHDVPKPEPKKPEPVVMPEPKCIVRQTVAHIRRATYGQYDRPFGVYPDHWGGHLDCLEWAKAKSLEMNLPVIEVPQPNPDLRARDFESPAIYLVAEEWDQFSPASNGRVFRY
jgi:hypothetical protein